MSFKEAESIQILDPEIKTRYEDIKKQKAEFKARGEEDTKKVMNEYARKVELNKTLVEIAEGKNKDIVRKENSRVVKRVRPQPQQEIAA